MLREQEIKRAKEKEEGREEERECVREIFLSTKIVLYFSLWIFLLIIRETPGWRGTPELSLPGFGQCRDV